jgi:hypothetical protein
MRMSSFAPGTRPHERGDKLHAAAVMNEVLRKDRRVNRWVFMFVEIRFIEAAPLKNLIFKPPLKSIRRFLRPADETTKTRINAIQVQGGMREEEEKEEENQENFSGDGFPVGRGPIFSVNLS